MNKKWRVYLKPFLIIFGIYCFAMLAIWLANVSYADDAGRAITGKGWTSDFNRYSSSLLSFLLVQMRFSLVDISPFGQILAMGLLAVSSLILVELFGDKKKLSRLIVATLAGLTPFTLSLWLYKFDAPCMALALLACVLPFAFRSKKNWQFGAISFVCLMIAMTSYQAFTGVFPLLLLALAFRDYLDKKSFNWRRIIFGLTSFLLSLLAFKFLLPTPEGYRSLEMWSLGSFIPGVFSNAFRVFAKIRSSFGSNWLIFLMLTTIAFIVSIILNSKRKGAKKALEVVAAIAFIVISIPLSYGIYLALADAPYNPRSLIGVGVAFAIIALLTLRGKKTRYFAAPAIVLVYLFVVYAFALGNALKYQHDYAVFRNSELAARLSGLYPNREDLASYKVQIQGNIGLAAQVKHTADLYPITREIIDAHQTGLSSFTWGSWSLHVDYGLSYDHTGLLGDPYDCTSFETRYDGYYERISESNSLICIEIK
ncbi:MAG: glucosyltransferase domain-containing protein [Candidatus Saccharibacteria bacterium]|nr:glucosyltransferase domain-containing protein [Candidatus Saccharibacteria bacterium]